MLQRHLGRRAAAPYAAARPQMVTSGGLRPVSRSMAVQTEAAPSSVDHSSHGNVAAASSGTAAAAASSSGRGAGQRSRPAAGIAAPGAPLATTALTTALIARATNKSMDEVGGRVGATRGSAACAACR